MLGAMRLARSRYWQLITISLCCLGSLLPATYCFGQADAGQQLRLLKRGIGYVFIGHDLTCQYGELAKVTDTDVLIETKQGNVTLRITDLLRIRSGFGGRPVSNDNGNLPLFTLYSGRSSWADVLAFSPFVSKGHPYSVVNFSLKTKDGKLHKGFLSNLTPDGITLTDKSGTAATFPKGEVDQVDYIREKPLSDTQEFYWEELGMGIIFDPQLYPRLFHLRDTMSVPLYRAALPESNLAIHCK
jgi:hypothetical protein